MNFEDKTLSCGDCQQPFLFAAGEQDFFAKRGLKHSPKRCPNCRVSNRMKRDGRDPATCIEVPCESCSEITRVPFKPTGEKPVYCVRCLRANKTG